jgi:hypothetical protein
MPETVVNFQIRMPPALHERLASLALERKESLNAMVVEALRAAVEAKAGGTPAGRDGHPPRRRAGAPRPAASPVPSAAPRRG